MVVVLGGEGILTIGERRGAKDGDGQRSLEMHG